ncbi:MAG: hypothetical protein Fur009_6110 [Candidatus Microgenomates bacterium]
MSLPYYLKPFLWSVKLDSLDLKKDSYYIIHQILAYGDLKAIKWLFKTYSRQEIINNFKKKFKDYRKQRFYFVKDILLELKNKEFNENYYVKNTPRVIR